MLELSQLNWYFDGCTMFELDLVWKFKKVREG